MSKSNPMSVATFVSIGLALAPKTSVLLRADHGLGKSQVIRQLRKKLLEVKPGSHEEFPLIDRRLSQMSEGDMIGLPSTDGEVTRFNPPDWYKKACDIPCVLFLDELNRATPEVMQAAFQIVLDRELNGWKLHPETRVYAAVNTGASYSVNEIDPALLDRFFVVDLDPTIKDWCEWAKAECLDESSPKFGKRNIMPILVDFIMSNDKWLDTPKNADPTRCNVSRRSWECVSDSLMFTKVEDDVDNSLMYPLVMGFVGTEAALALRDYIKKFDVRITGEDILERFTTKKIQSKMERQGQEGMLSCIEKLADHVINNMIIVNDKQGKNLKAFMEYLPGELRISCWSKLTTLGADTEEKKALAKAIHKHTHQSVLAVFGMKTGEDGLNTTPNIPAMFTEDPAKKDEK